MNHPEPIRLGEAFHDAVHFPFESRQTIRSFFTWIGIVILLNLGVWWLYAVFAYDIALSISYLLAYLLYSTQGVNTAAGILTQEFVNEVHFLLRGLIWLLFTVPVTGYMIVVVQSSLRNQEVPLFPPWRKLIWTGLEFSVILGLVRVLSTSLLSIIYLWVIPSEIDILFPILSQLESFEAIVTLGYTIGDLIEGLAYYFLIPALIAIYARRERVTDLLTLSQYKPILLDRNYQKIALLVIGFLYIESVAESLVIPSLYEILGETMLTFIFVQTVWSSLVFFPLRFMSYRAIGRNWKRVTAATNGHQLQYDTTNQRPLSPTFYSELGLRVWDGFMVIALGLTPVFVFSGRIGDRLHLMIIACFAIGLFIGGGIRVNNRHIDNRQQTPHWQMWDGATFLASATLLLVLIIILVIEISWIQQGWAMPEWTVTLLWIGLVAWSVAVATGIHIVCVKQGLTPHHLRNIGIGITVASFVIYATLGFLNFIFSSLAVLGAGVVLTTVDAHQLLQRSQERSLWCVAWTAREVSILVGAAAWVCAFASFTCLYFVGNSLIGFLGIDYLVLLGLFVFGGNIIATVVAQGMKQISDRSLSGR